MTTKTKGRNGGDRATPKTARVNFTATISHIKGLIVTGACWGFIPFKLADWLIQRGGLRDA